MGMGGMGMGMGGMGMGMGGMGMPGMGMGGMGGFNPAMFMNPAMAVAMQSTMQVRQGRPRCCGTCGGGKGALFGCCCVHDAFVCLVRCSSVYFIVFCMFCVCACLCATKLRPPQGMLSKMAQMQSQQAKPSLQGKGLQQCWFAVAPFSRCSTRSFPCA